jgi:hypothetical protein
LILIPGIIVLSSLHKFYQRDDLSIPVVVLASKNPDVPLDLTGKVVTNIVGRLQRFVDILDSTVDPLEVTGVVTDAAAGEVTYSVSSSQTADLQPGYFDFQPELTIDGKRGTLQEVENLLCLKALRDV